MLFYAVRCFQSELCCFYITRFKHPVDGVVNISRRVHQVITTTKQVCHHRPTTTTTMYYLVSLFKHTPIPAQRFVSTTAQPQPENPCFRIGTPLSTTYNFGHYKFVSIYNLQLRFLLSTMIAIFLFSNETTIVVA